MFDEIEQVPGKKLNVSPKYLNDSLKQTTGKTTQELVQQKLVEEAKDLLAFSQLSVSEIAYRLGFEYSQSFSKLFKNKTMQTPAEYRMSFGKSSTSETSNAAFTVAKATCLI